MALIFGIHDGDADRRQKVSDRLPKSLSGLQHLTRQSRSMAGLDIHWEASASAPVSIAIDRVSECQRLAWVVGCFDAPYTSTADAAQRLLERTCKTADYGCISAQDGYYLAVLFDETPRIVLGADTLGLFPLYYWAKGDVCLFGTSPELFKLHPHFVAKPSLFGVASVLLVNHISGGRSLYEGVRRTAIAHYVEWTPTTGARETEANPLRMSDRNFDAPYETSLEKVASCLDAFHKPLAGLPHADLFLSGGQDSRTVAGYMHKHLPRHAVRAVSLGIRSDQELRYAISVTRALGWPHCHRDVEFEKYPFFAMTQLRMESLQGPFASFDTRTALPLLAESGGPFLSGYLGDPIVGDGQVNNAISPITGEIEFDALLNVINGYGFSFDDAKRLLPGEAGKRALEEVFDNLRRDWDEIDAPRFQKAWLFAMTHRVRLHIGSIIWRLSLGAWPLLPYYAREMLDAVTSMPLSHLRNRRTQVDIIKREFPRLATLPLDRNVVGAEYIVTPLYRKFVPPISEVSWTLYRLLEHDRERRYYHRTYDFNAAGWRAVRREAEQYRARARDLLDAEAIDSFLPAADATPQFGNAVRDTSKTKTLLGLVMWYGSNFG
jgi:asparagine synthase (glutamine-hydrolysing)